MRLELCLDDLPPSFKIAIIKINDDITSIRSNLNNWSDVAEYNFLLVLTLFGTLDHLPQMEITYNASVYYYLQLMYRINIF